MLPKLLNEYVVLNSGGALGKGVGPLLITKNELPTSTAEDINDLTIAIPGEHTTANMLFSLAFPGANKKSYMVFSHIEDAVLTGKVDAGVIIHENRFTYAAKGLKKIVDLGEFWEDKTGLPIPLGGIGNGDIYVCFFGQQLFSKDADIFDDTRLIIVEGPAMYGVDQRKFFPLGSPENI